MTRRVAFVVTAHGYGHASRQMEVIRTLLARRPELEVDILTAAPESIFRDYLSADPLVSPRVRIVSHRADVGLVQRDGLSLDHEASLRALAARWGDPERAVAELCAVLSPLRPAAVVADIPAVAFPAAHRLGVPSAAVGNFDWADIYAHYAATIPAYAEHARLFRAWQALATVAVHLPPGPPLGGFARVVAGTPIARRMLVDPRAVRAHLALPRGQRAVLASFGGFGLDGAERRIPRVPGVTWILAPPMPDLRRDDTRFVDDAPYLGLLAACDAVFTKPGYGMVCEATRHRTRILYTDRGDFPEYPWLVRWMEQNVPSGYVASSALDERPEAAVREALEALFAAPDRWADRFDGAELVASEVEALL